MIIKNLKKKNLTLIKTPIKYSLYLFIVLTIFVSGALTYSQINTYEIKSSMFAKIKSSKNLIRTINSKITDTSEIIYIDVNFKNLKKLEKLKEKYVSSVFMAQDENSYVKAKIRNKNITLNAKIRFKGDSAETHLSGKDKWSFRVKINGENTLFGVKKFSIQRPETLQYIYEWLFNKAFAAENGIAKRYSFVRVYFNGEYWGVMSFHEHFDKFLIENNKRRAGPIIRFDKNKAVAGGVQGGDFGSRLGKTTALPITHYERNKYNEDKEFLENYNVAANMLEGLRQGHFSASEVLDLDKFAIYAALIDLFDGYHGFVDDNMVFYFNPATSLLEPIAEDVAPGVHTSKLSIGIADGFLSSNGFLWDDWTHTFGNRIILQSLFRDISFIEKYIYYLSKFSEKDYVESFFQSIEKELKSELNTLYADLDYANYSFDTKNNILFNNQQKIKNELNPPSAILSYFKKKEDKKVYLDVGSVQYFPLEVISISYQNNIFPIKKNKIIKGKNRYELVNYSEIEVEVPNEILSNDEFNNSLFINYKILGTNKVYSEKIYQSSIVSKNFQSDFVRRKPNYQDFKFIEHSKSSDKIIIKSGEWTLNKDLIIPAGFNFVIEPDTKINLNNYATILSFSPINFLGKASGPIIINSQDDTGQGISVIQSNGESQIQHTHFINLNSPTKKGFKLYGAVNFYESNVKISNSIFSQSKSEDALNIVRSKAIIHDTNFLKTKFDALDIDFSDVDINNLNFYNIGNDALDTSGSVVFAKNINIVGVGDKGLSIGEKSQLVAENISIIKSEIGLAVKDLSEVEIKKLYIADSNIGLTAFQKKKEFGPGSAVIEELKIERVKSFYFIEENSIIELIDIEKGSRRILKANLSDPKKNLY